MKILLLFFTFLSIQSNNTFNGFLDENYIGGSQVFIDEMIKTIKYPNQARTNCRIGQLKTRLVLTEAGEIEKIEFLNKLGSGIEETVEKAIKKTKGKWLKSETMRVFEFKIGFQIGISPVIPGDINITAIGFTQGNNREMVSCGSNKELLKDLTEEMKKKKFKKAKKLCEELLRREPDSEHYNSLKVMIEENLN